MDEVGRYQYNGSDGKGGYSSNHTKVGSYLPNAWGLYDMLGNVEELTLNWAGDYYPMPDSEDSFVVDPKGPVTPPASNRKIWKVSNSFSAVEKTFMGRRHDAAENWNNLSAGFRVICDAVAK